MIHTDVVIVGGGLSGLAAARALVLAGRNVTLFEARNRLGGRILSPAGFDLGPAWIWPHNRRMLALANAQGLTPFPQHAQGRLVFEAADGPIRRDLDFSTMAGALRLPGGLGALVERLAGTLPAETLRLGHSVETAQPDGEGLVLHGISATGDFGASAAQVILALPPRLVARLDLPVSAADRTEMAAIPTWMAGHAKLMAVYDRPFWRDAGLSGDAISHRGPLAEIHDAAPADATEGALFGFLGRPAGERPADSTTAAALQQLSRLFGPEAERPREVWLQDWAEDPETATQADRAPPTAHPAYRPPPATAKLAKRGIHLAGSETAEEDGGFLEGALVAAERAVAAVQRASAASSASSGKTGARIARS